MEVSDEHKFQFTPVHLRREGATAKEITSGCSPASKYMEGQPVIKGWGSATRHSYLNSHMKSVAGTAV